MWPFVDDLFRPDRGAAELEGVAVPPQSLRDVFDRTVPAVIAEAGLQVPGIPGARGGGRDGVHTEAFGHLLAEMQVLARAHPGATW
jgi:ring-1,2-phenylacetyl-CoA epoxidase subunit PaaC